ncbi:hypothetical protein [Marivirga lumbricoides]
MNVKKAILFLGIAGTLFMGGCYSELDDLSLGNIQWNPELGLPLVNSSFTIKDLLEASDSSFEYKEENDVIVIVVKEDSLFSSSAQDYYSLGDKTFPTLPLMLTPEEVDEFNNNGAVLVNREVAVDYGSDLDSIIIAMGTISLNLQENFPANGSLDLQFSSGSTPGSANILDYQYNWNYNGVNPITNASTQNTFFNTSFVFKGNDDQGKIIVSYQLSLQKVNDVDLVEGQNSVDLDFSFINMEFEALYGDLNTQGISTEENTIETNFFDADNEIGEFSYYLDDPRFKIIYTNTMGLPVLFTVNSFISFKDGEEEELTYGDDINLPAASFNSPAVQEVAFNEAIKTLLNDLPDSVRLQIDGVIDPDDVANNFVTRQSAIKIGYELEIPLKLSLENLLFNEAFEVSDLDTEDVQSIMFKFNSVNRLPIDVNLKAVFLDEDSVVQEVLFDGLLLKAGQSGQASNILEYITLSDNPDTAINELKFLEETKQIGISIRVATSTPVDGVQSVEISAQDQIDFSLAMQAKYKATIEND